MSIIVDTFKSIPVMIYHQVSIATPVNTDGYGMISDECYTSATPCTSRDTPTIRIDLMRGGAALVPPATSPRGDFFRPPPSSIFSHGGSSGFFQ